MNFGAAKAFAIVFFVLAAQVAVSAAIVLAFTIVAAASGKNVSDPRVVKQLTDTAMPSIVLASSFASLFVVVAFAKHWADDLLRDPSADGIGWRRPTTQQIVVATLSGVVIGLAFFAMTIALPPRHDAQPGPFGAMAMAGGWKRIVWAFVAIALAPPVEEMLFRGLMLKGLATSWGLRTACVVVTALFVVFHIGETFSYPLALIGITMLAIATLVVRLRTWSVFPAIALHAAYNLVIVVGSYFE